MSEAKAAIEAEVREVNSLEPVERKKRIRQLQLRWHPGKLRPRPYCLDPAIQKP